MTGPAAGEPDAGGGAPARPEQAAANGILTLLALGLAFRLIIAYLMPGSGFEVDLNAFRYWAANLASEGLYGFYERPFFHDYTPGYLYVLWVVGKVGQIVGGVGDLIKIPPIIADVILARVAWSMALDLRVDTRAARLVAFLIVVNPVTWFDSVLWGQVDAVGVVFLLLGLRELWRDRPERSAVLTVIAALIKPQLGILIPIVAAVTIRRALLPAGGFGADAPPEQGETTTSLERRVRGPVRIVTTGLAGLLTAIVLSLPFGLSFGGLVDQVFKTAGGYTYLTVNAYNPWALYTHEGHGLAKDGSWVCDFATSPDGAIFELGPLRLEAGDDWIQCADGVMIGPFPAVVVGAGLLLAAMAIAALLVARRPDRRTTLLALTFIAIAFFVLPTRVHERYMFPFVALGAILAGTSRRWFVAYVVGCAAMFANLYVVLTTLYPKNPGVEDWLGIGGFIRSYAGVAIVAAAHAAVLAFAAIALLRTLRRRAVAAPRSAPSPDDQAAPSPDARPEELHAARQPTAPALPAPAALPPEGSASADLPPVWERPAGLSELGAMGWLRDRLDRRPTRADRSHLLRDEPGGRFDRLDLWIVVVLAFGLLTMRIWRLGEPYQMHFDEVYHPRTATEFLQHWRYGIPHDIYEWTHPHLAKYAMAGGLVVWGEDRTSATSDLGLAVRDAAVEPRWDDAVRRDRVAGDRLWVVTGSELRAYDLSTRDPVGAVAIDGATTVGVDRTGHRVLVGTTDGRIVAVGTTPLDAARWAGTPAVLEAVPLADLDGAIDLLHVASDGSRVVASLDDGPVVTVDAITGSEVGRVTIGEPVAMVAAGADRIGIAAGALVRVLDLETGQATDRVVVGGQAGGITYVAGIDGDRFYVPFVGPDGPQVALVKLGKSGEATKLDTNVKLPGEAAGWAGYDEATRMVHVLGSRPGTDEATVYVIEPHGRAVHADAALPFEPEAIVLDDNQRYPSSDRQQLLAFAADGSAATVEIGRHPFAWRLPGVLAGVAMALGIYLLARLLFRRRAVALFAAIAVAVDGMLFVQSRIGMNDAYVGLGIVAAYCLFAAIWLRPGGRRRDWLAFALTMPAIGLILGLALAAKWVAAYAIGGIGLMILARSALGRLLLVAGLVALTTVLGYLAISVPEGTTGGNWLFLFLMVGLTLLAAVVNVLHPIAWTWEEHRLLVVTPPVLGGLVFLGALALGRVDTAIAIGPVSVTPGQLALALALIGVVAQGVILAVGRFGFGPLAVAPPADDPARLLDPPAAAPRGWLRLGSGFGLPLAWMAICLIVLPLGVYVASYLPWAALPGHVIVPGFPAGQDGQTLLELTSGMYRYHNNLSTGHAASSPWWAWALDLKPVWFYHESFAGGTSAAIYDAGNLVAWWLAIPAMGFAAWQAFHRRSAALALVTIAFACQWLSWSRIDRAAFQYHYYTSLPFLLIALAYFLAELWNGPSRRTWLLARLAGAAMVLGPFGMWLLHRPLCAFVRVEDANEGSWACPTVIPEMVVSGRAIALAAVVGIGAVLLIRAIVEVGRGADDDPGGSLRDRRGSVLRAGLVAGGVGSALVAVMRFVPEASLFRFERVIVEPIALLVTLALLPVAATVATARDARRWVVGAVAAIVGFFVLWYPNIAALPLPTAFHNVFQGLLPTYLYAFQFPVSGVDRNVGAPALLAPGPLLLLVALAAVAVGVGYSAWVWRITETERRLAPGPAGPPPGSPPEAPPERPAAG